MRVLWVIPFLLISVPAWAQGVLTLRDALRMVETNNPAVLNAKAGLAAAEGEARESRGILYNNPELSLEHGRRTSPTEGGEVRTSEPAVGISQTFEIAGQQGHRREAARWEMEATRAQVLEAVAKGRGEVEQAFYEVLALQSRAASENEIAKLAEDAANAVGKRVAAGEDSKLDGNLALVEAERARNQVETLREELVTARARLAELLQLPPTSLPEVVGDLTPAAPSYSLPTLLESIPRRPHLASLESREQAAISRLALERAAAVPDVTVGLNTAREGPQEFRERVTTLSVSIPLPFFRRNDAAIGRAMTERDRVQIERRAALRDTEAQVRALWQRFQSLDARVKRLSGSVLARLDENLSLSTKAYRAGEIGILQLVVVNRQVLDARRDYLAAVTEWVKTRVALEQAAGWGLDSSGNAPSSR
jgi:cobalt-zinc-cadmium efflux system outer membrane protein